MPFRPTPWTLKVATNPAGARRELERAIAKAGSVAGAAAALGLSRQVIYSYMAKLNIQTPREDRAEEVVR